MGRSSNWEWRDCGLGEKLVALAQIKLYVNGASVAVMIGDQRGNCDASLDCDGHRRHVT